jgi:hypothetical protein
MKRNIVYAFMLTLALVLSACGGNSIEDVKTGNTPTTPNPDTNTSGKIITTLKGITIDKANGDISANVAVTSSYASSVVATLSDMDITLGGCPLVAGSVSAAPSAVTLDTTTPTKNVTLIGKMADASCVPTSYQLKGTNTILENGKTAVETFTAETGTIASSDITFDEILPFTINAIDAKLDINESVEKAIRIRLSQGVDGVSGKNIKAGNVLHGTLFASVVKTDEFGQVIFAYTPPSPIVDNVFSIEFCLEDDTSLCTSVDINLTTGAVDNNDTNTTPDVGNDFVNYGMTFITDDGGNTLGLDERKRYIISLIDKDTQTVIPASQVEKITIESKKPDVLKLIDPSDAIGAAVSKLEISGKSSINIYLKAAQRISGLSDIKITINYTNQKGFDRVLTSTYAISVLSGPPTALSINSAGVSYNFEEKWFEHKFLVSASDKYSNKINTSPTISASVMAGYAKDSAGNRIIYGQNSKNNLGIYANLTGSTAQVELDSVGVAPFNTFNPITLQGVDLSRDIVAMFGNVRTYEANGKWEIDSVSSASKLILSDIYEGEDYVGVGLAVGHNYRQDLCSSEYLEYQTKVDSTDGTYKLDDEGKTFVTVKFPAIYMPGKKVGLLINLISENPETGKQLRGGEVKFTTLHSFEGLSGVTVSIPKGTTMTVTHFGSVETGTVDTWFLQNSTFSCSTIDSTGLTDVTITGRNNPDDCVRPYIEYSVTAAADEDGSLVLSKCQVNNEFSF